MTRRNLPDLMTDAASDSVESASRAVNDGQAKVPGPSPNSATNLIIADVGFRALSVLFRQTMEKGMLRARFSPSEARDIVQGRTIAHSLASYMIAKTATRSVPGFLAVTAGLAAKALYDRGLARNQSEADGDETLRDVGRNARED